jgi:tetratricopeptide (TPR) repeat protein
MAVVCLAQNQSPNQTENQAQSPTPNQSQNETQSQDQGQPQSQGQSQTPSQTPNQAEKQAPKKAQNPPQPQVANQTPITLDTNETLFTVLTALNSCGYDIDLNISDAQRLNVRAEVQRNLRESEDAQAALTSMCDWYQGHKGKDPEHDLSQFVSLALYLQGPPHFMPRVKEEEMPPDAAPLTGFGALLERFYDKASLHSIWEAHRTSYAALVARYHEPLAKMVFDTDIYLKLQSGGYLGRTFTILLDVMGDPTEANARNYGADYYVVVFPSPDPTTVDPLKMPQIRHTYLHYLLDPMADKHFSGIKRLEPLLQSVKNAPLEENFKSDISLLVTECLVRAIEIRTSGTKQTAEAMRLQAVDDAARQGYILTKYFYNAIVTFEKDPAGLRTEYGDIINAIDIKQQQKAASEIQFARNSKPELVQLSRMEDRRMLTTAEKRLAAGDPKGAQELAQQAIDKKIGDEGRALFILAQVAVANKNPDGAADNFRKAIQATKDPKVVAWSHVYLGRMLDMRDPPDREAALGEYRAALTAGSELPEAKAAAERGLQNPYEPPPKPKPQEPAR